MDTTIFGQKYFFLTSIKCLENITRSSSYLSFTYIKPFVNKQIHKLAMKTFITKSNSFFRSIICFSQLFLFT